MSSELCPECGKGPFPTVKGFKAHLRGHVIVECPDCGATMKALGLGSHRRRAHGVVGQSAPARYSRAQREQARADREHARRAAGEPPQFPGRRWVRCATCGIAVRAGRLDHHRATEHPTVRAQPAAPPPMKPPGPAVADALAGMLGAAAPDVLERLAAFVDKHEPDEGAGLLVVATAGGMWLCRAQHVGQVVARERTVAVVVAVDDIYAHARRDRVPA